jgi:hypothetical protein
MVEPTVVKILFGAVLYIFLCGGILLIAWLRASSALSRKALSDTVFMEGLLKKVDNLTKNYRAREAELTDGLERDTVINNKCTVYREYVVDETVKRYEIKYAVIASELFIDYADLLVDVKACGGGKGLPPAEDVRWKRASYIQRALRRTEGGIMTRLRKIGAEKEGSWKRDLLETEMCYYMEADGIHKLIFEYEADFGKNEGALNSMLYGIEEQAMKAVIDHPKREDPCEVNIEAMVIASRIVNRLKKGKIELMLYLTGGRPVCDLLHRLKAYKPLRKYLYTYPEDKGLDILLLTSMGMDETRVGIIRRAGARCGVVSIYPELEFKPKPEANPPPRGESRRITTNYDNVYKPIELGFFPAAEYP